MGLLALACKILITSGINRANTSVAIVRPFHATVTILHNSTGQGTVRI